MLSVKNENGEEVMVYKEPSSVVSCFFDGLGTTEGLDFSLDAIQTSSSLLDFDSLVRTTVDPFIQTTADPFGFDLFPASTES